MALQMILTTGGGGGGSAGSLPTVYESVGDTRYVVAAGIHTMFTGNSMVMTLFATDYEVDDIIHFSMDTGNNNGFLQAAAGEDLDGRTAGRVRLIETRVAEATCRLDATRGWVVTGDFSEA